ncbi:MAG: T9SS type A sorting domain-containing protein [Bacteroidales bacterium]|nr:T9SS type A sorting domain-containing protein [Bacteroidales bacterium]
MKKIILLLSVFACISVSQAQTVAHVYFYNTSNGYWYDTLPLSIGANIPAEGRYTLSQVGLSSFKVAIVMENNRGSDMLTGDAVKILMSYNGKNLLNYSIELTKNIEVDSFLLITLDEYVLIGGLTRIGSNDICYEIEKYNEISVNDKGSCVVMKLDNKVSIEENALSMAKVYPNPVRNTLTIDNVADANISIYSITGQLVKTIPAANGSIQVDMSAMAAGLYIVKMENGKQTRIEKIQVVK